MASYNIIDSIDLFKLSVVGTRFLAGTRYLGMAVRLEDYGNSIVTEILSKNGVTLHYRERTAYILELTQRICGREELDPVTQDDISECFIRWLKCILEESNILFRKFDSKIMALHRTRQMDREIQAAWHQLTATP